MPSESGELQALQQHLLFFASDRHVWLRAQGTQCHQLTIPLLVASAVATGEAGSQFPFIFLEHSSRIVIRK